MNFMSSLAVMTPILRDRVISLMIRSLVTLIHPYPQSFFPGHPYVRLEICLSLTSDK